MADRYRAYATIKADRPTYDSTGKVTGMAETDASGDVAFEGNVPADGVVKLDAGDVKIRRVAFYSGPLEEEVCLGSVEVNSAGKIKADVADIPRE